MVLSPEKATLFQEMSHDIPFIVLFCNDGVQLPSVDDYNNLDVCIE